MADDGVHCAVYIGHAKRYSVYFVSSHALYKISVLSQNPETSIVLFIVSSDSWGPWTVTLGRAFGPFTKFSAASVVIEVSGK